MTARVKRPKLLMVICGITGTVGALATWMLRRVAILNVKRVGFDHRCWSNTAAEAKQKNVALTVGQQTVEFFKPCKKTCCLRPSCCHTRPQSCWIRYVEEVYDIEILLKYCTNILLIYSVMKYRGSLWYSPCCQPLLTPWLRKKCVFVCVRHARCSHDVHAFAL